MNTQIDILRDQNIFLRQDLDALNSNKIGDVNLDDYIFNRVMQKVDPIYYIENTLRAHLPEKKRHLHENQIELVRAVCNPSIRRVAALMARQAGKTESIASFVGYLLDNYPQMRIGIFTPKVQQAEINVGRTSVFYQRNEEKLNNKIIKCNKQRIELSNGSYVMAVSGSDQSNIEGLTFDIIILDEAQKISDYTWSERIMPMGGATNAKMIKIGTPKTRNHFYQSFQSEEGTKTSWTKIRRDWTQCPQLWALDSTMLPDRFTGELRPYSTYVLGLMPKSLKQEYFPNNPEIWTEGDMTVEDFKTQYMLEFIDGAGKFFGQADFDRMRNGDFEWLSHGQHGELYYAGIDFAGSGAATADFTHITVLRVAPNGVKQKVYAMEMHGVSYPEQIRTIVRMFYGREAQFQCRSIFADFTGVGRPVIDSLIYDYGLTNLTGITFNGRDVYTNSGMNLKNVMFARLRQDVENDKFKYPDKENFLKSAGSEKNGFYHKMLGEWADLEQETRTTVNKIIQAPTGGHDDVCCADVLANFASIVGSQNKRMPKASSGNFTRLR